MVINRNRLKHSHFLNMLVCKCVKLNYFLMTKINTITVPCVGLPGFVHSVVSVPEADSAGL
jgi:hypothetical protein